MTYRVYVGVDGGLDGGLSVMEGTDLYWTMPMPTIGTKKREYDVQKIISVFKELQEQGYRIHVTLEKMTYVPRFSRVSIASLSRCYGLFEGILSALGIPYEIVSAKTWQGTVLKDMDRTDTKQASITYCLRKWPDKMWKKSERAKKYSDGLTDSACIAEYGYLKHHK